jgi:cellulose biosynthesis protein BcsQ
VAEVSGRVLAVDTDPQGTLTDLADSYGEAFGPDFTAEASDAAGIARLRDVDAYDSILIDTPGHRSVMSSVFDVADLVVIPCPPEYAAVRPTLRTAQLCADHGARYIIVASMVDRLRGPKPLESLWSMLDEQGQPRARTYISRRVAWTESQLQATPMTAYHGDRSWRPALEELRKLQTELLIMLGRKAGKAGRHVAANV